jgi:hypothetical protein
MVTFDGSEVNETTDGQSLFIAFTPINHPVDVLREDFSRL